MLGPESVASPDHPNSRLLQKVAMLKEEAVEWQGQCGRMDAVFNKFILWRLGVKQEFKNTANMYM